MSEIVVVKLGGTTLADQKQVLAEVAVVARDRPVVLVHGGGKRMTEWLDRLGVETRFEGGLRVTDPAALEVAAAVLRGVVNSELVAALRDVGCDAVGLSGVDGGLLIGERLPDVGLVATVVGVRRDLLDSLLVGGLKFVLGKIAQAVDAELDDEQRLREELLAAQLQLELGELSEKEFAALERTLLARLRELRAQSGQPAPGDMKVTGVEARTWDDE